MNNIKVDENNVKRCPKCGDVMGTNIDGEPICACSVPPRSIVLSTRRVLYEDINRPHISR